jgi:hypothetical protein
MPLYRYSGSSTIDEVRFFSNENGGTRAYLHAAKHADPEKLQAVIHDLNKQGFVTSPCHLNGQEVLEVRGFGKESKLRAALGEVGAVHGHPHRDELGDDKLDVLAWFKQKSLIISALFYLVGDFCFIKYEKVNTKIKDTKKDEKHAALNAAIATFNTDKSAANKVAEYTDVDNRSKFAKSKVWDWLAGYGYLAGSTSSLASLMLRGDTSQMELGSISRFISDAARDAGLEVAGHPALQNAMGLHDTRSKAAKVFTTYSAEMMNLSFATAGLAIAKDSFETHQRLSKEEKAFGHVYDFSKDQRHLDDKSVAFKDVVLGTGTVLSGVTSSIIKEKPVDPNKQRKKGVAGVIEYMKERPLRIAGAGYLISTVIHLWSSLQERGSIKNENKIRGTDNQFPTDHTTYRLGFVIMNLIAEVIMYFSSKGHGEGMKSDESLDITATSMVAQMIAKKPLEEREALVNTMAEALAQQQALGIKVDKAKTMLHEQLAALEKNPWAKAVAVQVEPSAPVVMAEKAAEEKAHAISDLASAPEAAPVNAATSHGITPREKTIPVQTSLIERAVAEPSFAGATL